MRRVLALAAAFALVGLPLEAHNRGVVHPEITDVAMEVLRAHDMINNGGMSQPLTLTDPCPDCAFNELWDRRGVLMPPPGPQATADLENANAYIDAYNDDDAASIILGSVIEDGWGYVYTSLTSFNHFHHARSGAGLHFAGDDYMSSRLRAPEIFIFGLRLMDYTDQSVDRASLYVGRLMHLVEDKSSPAHVHNDAHAVLDEEIDDYEARYVPEFWRDGELRTRLRAATAPVQVVNATQIWPVPVALHSAPPNDSLAGFIYNGTTYWSTLQYPMDGVPPPGPTGELAEMFPGDLGDPADDGLHWVSPSIGFDRWVIDGVGEYHYKASWGAEDEWWPDTAADQSGAGNPGGIEAAYYIENLITGTDLATAVVPDRHRADINTRWHPINNPVVQNAFCNGGTNDAAPCSKQPDCPGGVCEGEAIVQRMADNMLDKPVMYAAGMAMWWDRFANMPAYLKKVEATQNSVLKYAAEWLDENPPQIIEHELREIGPVIDTDEDIETITKRNFSYNPLTRLYVNALNDLDLVLEFNEPIKEVTELALLDGQGATVLDIAAIVPAPVKTDEDTKWTYTIPAANLMGLNGELTLKVKAEDKNEHTQGGADLDATPQSPAKRNLDGTIDLNDPIIPWHTDATNKDQAYDFTSGDLNHRLLFDTEKPTTTIYVTP